MSNELYGVIGFLVLLALMATGMPIAFAFALVGVFGFSYMVSFQACFSLTAMTFFNTISSYELAIIPLFVFMGYIAFYSGVSERLFSAGHKLFGRIRGSLYMGTIIASALFGACCGSSPASAATMGAVALPEMRRYKYADSLAGGCVAASGSLAILIPPSITLVIYAILTEQSVGKLFIAGIIPGIMMTLLFLIAIIIITRINPKMAPPAISSSWKEKLTALFKGSGEIVIVFTILIGGLFIGLFTPTETGAIGAAAMLILALSRRTISWKGFISSLSESLRTAAMILLIIAGAHVFGYFLAVTRLPFSTAEFVGSLNLSPAIIMVIIVLVYLVLGCFMDTLAMIVLTIPIFFPVILELGFDPIWFGVMIVIISEMGLITPPVGINVYVIKGVMKDVSLETIFKGIYPFLICELILAVILIAFPQIVLFLPGLMK